MIVNKIYEYLSSEGKTLDEALRYEVEKLAGVSFKRQFMTEENGVAPGVLRLSSAGKCARQLAYKYHGLEIKGKTIDARAKIIFFQGDLVELMLASIAKLSGCNITATGLHQATVDFKVGENLIKGHTDGLLIEPGEVLLVEFKSMSSYAFKRFLDGYIDDSYITQYNTYLSALGVNRCVFVGLNKDNGVLHEMVITKDEIVVESARRNLLKVIESTPETLPDRPYFPDDKGFYPWQCAYCPAYETCLIEPGLAERVVVRDSYKLKEKKDAKLSGEVETSGGEDRGERQTVRRGKSNKLADAGASQSRAGGGN